MDTVYIITALYLTSISTKMTLTGNKHVRLRAVATIAILLYIVLPNLPLEPTFYVHDHYVALCI